MSHRDFTEVEPEGTSELPAANRALFLEKVRQSNTACQNGDFSTAVALYTEALQLDPTNHILYSNRSAAKLKQGLFAQALQDAITARDLCPTWPKAYYRQGVALQCLGRHGDALAAFSQGLAQDPTSQQLLSGLVEASIKSPLRHNLEPTFQQLEVMKLDQSPFVLISVVGQELLAAGLYHSAVTVLESALRIGSCSLKLRGSVFSALSSAHWALNQLDKAIGYMQQDLAIAKSLGDTAGECRAHGNLGSAYFSQGSYKEALTAHRYQLVLAMKCKDTQAAAAALTSLGHVYTAIGDYPNALASHKQCVQLVKQMGDRLQEAREIGNVGAVYLAMGDFDSAVDCHTQHLRIARRLGNQVEEARAYSNLGSSHHYKRNFAQAIVYHEKVLRLAQAIGDKSVEARAYAGLGHAARCAGDYVQAKQWHERQLDVALATRDKVGEGRACSNLGIVYQLLGENDAALKLHQAHLAIARSLQDRAGMGRAYGNIGNAYSAAGFYESAIKYHKQELTISKEVHDRSSEASTHGNLAVAYQALGAHDMALLHYRAHLGIARELKDTAGEACALLNLANCLSSRSEFAEAIPYYEQYLMLSQELADVEGEAKACHFLGYAHYCIGNFREAVRYYDQDLALAKDLQDKMNMGRAYCNLGLAHLALGQLETSLECQKYFLAIAHMTNNLPGKFRALGNIGDVLIKMGETEEAVKMYHRQLALARSNRDRGMEAAACGALGIAHRLLKRLDKALGYHTQELTLRQEMSELSGECRAHGHLGAVHMALGNYTHAVKCYQEQLERAQELQDCAVEAQAYGNLGIARLNMAHYEDAIGYFEQQLATLERLSSPTAQLDKGRAFGNLGDCYDALGDPEEAAKCHEQHLAIALKLKSVRDQERAYRGLGQAQKALTNLQQALVCLEKRLVVAHELANPEAKAAAYGELGQLHANLGNLEQAISCLDHQKAIARELNDKIMEADAISNLGCVYQQMGEYTTALRYHQTDLDIAEQLQLPTLQSRACGNLGAVHEALGNLEQAIRYQEQHLSIAASTNDQHAKTVAYSSLGRVHQLLGNRSQAVAYLSQGLSIAEALGRRDEEARIRNRLGLTLWSNGDLEGAQKQLEAATNLLENIRREARNTPDYKLSLFELQSSSYQVLQRVLVGLNRHEEALVVAERGRNRAFVDLLLERQGLNDGRNKKRFDDVTASTLDQIKEIVNRQRASVLYYSIAAGFLYSWLIVPTKGIVKFHSKSLNESDESDSTDPTSNIGILEKLVTSVRDSLGMELSPCSTINEDQYSDDTLSDRTGFLRMVNRQHLLNSSNYSLSSLFSLGSVGGSVASLQGSTRSSTSVQATSRQAWKGPSCLHALYTLLIQPFEDFLPKANSNRRELILVLEGDLYLVPFPVLRSSSEASEYLCERFSLLAVPNISSLRIGRSRKQDGDQTVRSLIVGNPKLPNAVTEHWGWKDIPQAEQEATMVAELLQAQVLLGAGATKEQILNQIQDAECVHFSTHVSWKLSSLVLSPAEVLDQSQKRLYLGDPAEEDENEVSTSAELPPMSEFLLSAADILSLRLSARLVVVSSSHTRDQQGWATSDGLVALVRALLAAGAQAVLVSLWPVPETASKILLRAFYSAMLQGTRAAKALAEAMQTVQHTKHFAHPANWAGFLLVGLNVRLSNKVAMMGQALCELLQVPDKCRDALRVTLHLVEKSLQRIHRGQKNAMYTTQKSIENKVGSVTGWRDLLISVGFRFEPASNGIPSSVFFPQSDPDERLTQCSASLQALLALSNTSIHALSKLTINPDVSDDIIGVIQSALAQFTENESVELGLNVRLWRVPGCHELLASLGFDLTDVGQDKVTLRLGKQANRRNIQFTLQALLALFDTQEAPKSLTIDSSSSLESLASVDNDFSHSDNELCQAPKSPQLAKPRLNFSRTVLPTKRLGGAFTSYVRRRGEPDGRTANPSDTKTLLSDKTRKNVGRPETEAAFTPSPPVVLQSENQNIALSLAHQTRIKNLYSQNDNKNDLRPDSSSSASSVTDWDNGHATVLRRQTQIPPLPPSRTKLDLTLYNNLPSRLFENSSDSELEKMEAKLFNTRNKMAYRKSRMSTLDRLSVRTELTPQNLLQASRKPITLPSEETLPTNERLLYFSPSDVDTSPQKLPTDSDESKDKPDLHDTILRHINRELTPTISDVYHERNIGLGLAPPLSKLLLNQPTNATPQTDANALEKITLGILEEGGEPWMAEGGLQQIQSSDLTTADILEREVKNKKGLREGEVKRLSPFSEMSRRDEGDGRSIADSNCSSYKNRFGDYRTGEKRPVAAQRRSKQT
ncbi:tetratricopeptide repeat protein 28 [Tribolium castaneum]|uniref:Tetratricopeptide repeat protein 28-like Protein n=1 Tax=Tribolium castaneum TaxID=7070 RepID=D2A5Q3_TRICA|nr:PREDICTED: tetratricopeptide repeat protein 28 [Tribolium castaneum]EFA05041.2 Tetratricopeptide repeat protein 28-like Protein [Tribolium castaneum]|eukprot:XP_008194700.1 PREDICTED: tetratricopeptide repeat protein 28 [Tribolium castaneum]